MCKARVLYLDDSRHPTLDNAGPGATFLAKVIAMDVIYLASTRH